MSLEFFSRLNVSIVSGPNLEKSVILIQPASPPYHEKEGGGRRDSLRLWFMEDEGTPAFPKHWQEPLLPKNILSASAYPGSVTIF